MQAARWHIRLLGAATAAVTIAGLAVAVPALAGGGRTALPGSALPAAAPGVQDGGRLAADRTIQIALHLDHPDRAGEERTARAVNDPSSPSYRHFLSPSEYAARFGASTARRAAVQQFLTGAHLSVTFESGTHLDWLATGKVADVERAFGTTLRVFHDGTRTFYGPTTAPTVPAGLGVRSVGLTDRFQLETHNFPASASTTPRDLWSIYRQPSDNTGEGEQIALFGWGVSDGVESDLRAFEAANGLPQAPFRVQRVGAPPDPTDTSGKVEWDMDSQASTGMAPGVLLETFYFATSGNVDDGIAALAAWAGDATGAHQGSASYGLCEDNPAYQAIGNGYSDSLNAVLTQAVAEGRTLFASSGDTGSGCPPPAAPAVNGVEISPVPMQEMPAASPWAVAVGGTVITTKDGASPAERDVEYSWTHGGGGSSAFQALPDYQQGVAAITIPCAASPDGSPNADGHTCRGVPDVAAQSGDLLSGMDIVVDGAPTTGAGTSLSSPLWAGMWTRVQAASAPLVTTSSATAVRKTGHHRATATSTASYPGLGFANPHLYAIGKDPARYAKAFYDVTTGANGLYHAAAGWDYTTGWGSPDVTGIALDLDGATAPTHKDATAPAPPPPATATIDACRPLWTDPAGDEGGALGGPVDPREQQDLLRGDITNDATALHVSATVTNLSTDLPAGATYADYYTFFDIGTTHYYADATVDPTGAVTYSDGTTDGNGNFTPVHTGLTGQFNTGPNGTVVVDVPLANIGSPATGTRLQGVYTDAFLSSDPADVIQWTADEGGPNQPYAIGETCVNGVSTVPADPSAPAPTPTPEPTGGACPAGAPQITDPEGDSYIQVVDPMPASNDDTDIVSGAYTWNGSALKLLVTVKALRGDLDPPPPGSDGEVFDIGFTVGGSAYYGRFTRTPIDGATFVLRTTGSGTAGTSDTTVGDLVNGSFDPATNTASAEVPTSLLPALQSGAVLSGLHIDSGQDEQAVLFFNDHASATCTTTL